MTAKQIGAFKNKGGKKKPKGRRQSQCWLNEKFLLFLGVTVEN